jgi:pimeloyl-ACP methyl ester carboxylesterase
MVDNLQLLLKNGKKKVLINNIMMHFSYKKSTHPHAVLLFLPGNPGAPDLYEMFLSKVYNDLLNLDIWCPSYLEMVVTLDQLVDQVVGFVDLLVSSYSINTKFIIAGHSFGSYLTVQLLKRRPNLNILKLISLFPSLQWIAETPRGLQISPFTEQVPRTLISFLVAGLHLLPKPALQLIIRTVTGLPNHAVDAVSANLLVRDHVNSVLYLANCEMQQIRDLEVEAMRSYQHLWLIYVGEGDGWCPDSHIKDISEKLNVELIQCVEKIDHAFVLEDSFTMAKKMVDWIKSIDI